MDYKPLVFFVPFTLLFCKYLILSGTYLDLIALSLCGLLSFLYEFKILQGKEQNIKENLDKLDSSLHTLLLEIKVHRERLEEQVKQYRNEQFTLDAKVAEVRSMSTMNRTFGK